MPDCPECAKRPYLCFEHNEQAREDEETLDIFAARWDARLAREQAFAKELAKAAFYAGRKVAKGEMLLSRAQEMLAAKTRTVDETMPVLTYVLPVEAAEAIIAEAFARGHRLRRAA